MTDVLRIFGLWRGRAPWLAAGVIVSLAALGAGVAMMGLGGAMVAAAISAGVLAAPLALRVAGIARVVLRYAERVVTHDATFRALADLRVWFFLNVPRSGAGGLGFRQAGDVLARLVGDIEALDGLYLRILVPLAGAALLLPVLVVVIALHSISLALAVGILFAAAAFLLPWTNARAAAGAGAALADATGMLRIAALDALTGLREVRAFGAEGRMLAAVQAREARLLAEQRALARRAALASAGALLCGQAALLAVLIAAGTEPVPAVVAAFLLVAAFEAAGGLPRAGVLAGHAAAAARRVLEAADAPTGVPEPVRPVATPDGFALRFEGVHFRWQPDRPPVFDGLTLEVPERARVVLLGPSGAGKSTLAALAMKVAAPQQGRVMLGGVDIAALAATDVHRRIGWLAQATHLFDDTIRANLKLARPDAGDAALWNALDAARIGEMVRALPDGLDTWVGESGARLSGGQGRRLALARALLSPAPILILDEPCSGLDAETERAFLATLNEVAEGRSVILITHRLTGVERLDRIWRLSGGKAIAAAA
jgi:ATP-binding cassette subfamily C protein CydC